MPVAHAASVIAVMLKSKRASSGVASQAMPDAKTGVDASTAAGDCRIATERSPQSAVPPAK